MTTSSDSSPASTSSSSPSLARPITTRHPRGLIAPPLPADAPSWRRLRRALYRLGHGLALHDGLMAAPAMAFHFFLSLLPLLVFIGYIVGQIARRRGVDAVLSPVLDSLPQAAELVVRKEVERLAGASGTALGPVAAGTFLWIASGGTHGLMNAVENVVGAPRRPWWKKRVLSLAWVVASLGAFALASFALVTWDSVVHARPSVAVMSPRPVSSNAISNATSTSSSSSTASSSVTSLPSSSARAPGWKASSAAAHAELAERPPADPPRRRRAQILRSSGERALGLALSMAFATAVLAAFYRLAVSHSKRLARRVLPGALVAVGLWLVISWAFGLYVSTLASYAVFYGSLAAVAVLLVWLWLTSLAILIGAELNSQLEGLRD